MASTILLFGASAMIAPEVARAFASTDRVVAVGRTDPRPLGTAVDSFVPLELLDEEAVRRFLSGRRGDRAWVNLAARTDVDGCEAERPAALDDPGRPPTRGGSAWRLNAELPGWLAESSAQASIPLVQLSTDFVFDGADGPYREDAPPASFGPRVGWYGYTKGVGEDRVRSAGGPAVVIRIASPYGAPPGRKTDFAQALLGRARSGTLYPLYSDQQFTPTWVPDLGPAIARLLEASAYGNVHLASPVGTTPWEFGRELLDAFGLPLEGLRSARLADRPSDPARAPRPIHGGLRVDRARSLGLLLTDIHEGIRALRSRAPSG